MLEVEFEGYPSTSSVCLSSPCPIWSQSRSCPRSVASLSHPAWADWRWKIRANTWLGWQRGKGGGTGGVHNHLPVFILYGSRAGLINGTWLYVCDKVDPQCWTQSTQEFSVSQNWDFFFLVLHFKLWNCSLLSSPAAAPLLKSLQSAVTLTWLAVSLDAGQNILLSWLQQTGNAPQQVMLQALFRCVARCLRGKLGSLLLLRLSICSHNASFFLGRWEQPRSWTVNAV